MTKDYVNLAWHVAYDFAVALISSSLRLCVCLCVVEIFISTLTTFTTESLTVSTVTTAATTTGSLSSSSLWRFWYFQFFTRVPCYWWRFFSQTDTPFFLILLASIMCKISHKIDAFLFSHKYLFLVPLLLGLCRHIPCPEEMKTSE